MWQKEEREENREEEKGQERKMKKRRRKSLLSTALSKSRTWSASPIGCESELSEGLMPGHLSQNVTTVYLLICEINGFAILVG